YYSIIRYTTYINTLSLHDALPIYIGLNNALIISAATILLGLLITRNGPIELGNEADFAEAQQTDKLVLARDVSHSDGPVSVEIRSEEHTSELQSRENLICRLLLEK